MSFKVFCRLRAMLARVISGCLDRASNPDRSPVRRARHHNARKFILRVGGIKTNNSLIFMCHKGYQVISRYIPINLL